MPAGEPQPDRPDGGPPLVNPVGETTMESSALTSRTRRSFLTAAIATVAGVGGWEWLRRRPKWDEALWPLRKAFQTNEKLARAIYTNQGGATTRPFGSAPKGPRVNGDLGLDGHVDVAKYRVALTGIADDAALVSLDDIRALPKVEQTAQLCCIEGWSIFVNWGGCRFTDFMKKFPPNTRSGRPFDVEKPDDLLPYIAMATPDDGYYVGLDLASAMHPQTMLCYEIDGQPLTAEHGAPLRLVIPTKYGIKNIKRIGSIAYTDKQPKDYWAEQGYDWYSGL